MKRYCSWEYETILTELFNDKYLEIFEYRGKTVIRIGRVDSFIDVEFDDEQKGWEFFNKLVESFSLLK